ncbi:hypothetical protein ILYODFUR_015233 [Ilyodon furcidens]|uniref:Uncharacterized protein n=1 Tax=Ilyodon furcidens TaxID=33524 RepID=A0ABV0U5K9_9TELE
MSTPLDLAESTSEKDAGLSVSLLLLEPALWKLKTILPSVRSPACPPFTSCWKHLLKRIQVTERDTAFSTESHLLPNSASADRSALPRTFNSNSNSHLHLYPHITYHPSTVKIITSHLSSIVSSLIVLRPPDDQPNHLHCFSRKTVKPVILPPYLCSLSECNC